jgi:hypothetical protein
MKKKNINIFITSQKSLTSIIWSSRPFEMSQIPRVKRYSPISHGEPSLPAAAPHHNHLALSSPHRRRGCKFSPEPQPKIHLSTVHCMEKQDEASAHEDMSTMSSVFSAAAAPWPRLLRNLLLLFSHPLARCCG